MASRSALWRRIPSFPSCEASSAGQIRHVTIRKVKNQHMGKRKYLCVGLWRSGKNNTRCVHRLVCKAFHGKAPAGRNDAAHRDGDRRNNRSKNLRWKSRKGNEADKIRHGRTNRGQRNGMAKLTNAQAKEFKRLAAKLPKSSGGAKMKKGALAPLAKKFGISPAGARLIIGGIRRSSNGI